MTSCLPGIGQINSGMDILYIPVHQHCSSELWIPSTVKFFSVNLALEYPTWGIAHRDPSRSGLRHHDIVEAHRIVAICNPTSILQSAKELRAPVLRVRLWSEYVRACVCVRVCVYVCALFIFCL